MAEEDALTNDEKESVDIVLSCVNAIAVDPGNARELVDRLTEGYDLAPLLDTALSMLLAHFVIAAGGMNKVTDTTGWLRDAINGE